jgi:hypothetical protein
MTAPLLLVVLATLPAEASQRYRWEIAGEAVGLADLSVGCRGTRCTVRWATVARAPEAGGGAVVERRVEAETDRAGRLHAARVGSAPVRVAAGERVAASLAEVLLAGAAEGERRCVDVEEEETGERGSACAVRRGDWLTGTVLGAEVRFRPGPDGLPREVALPGQGSRFVADARAVLPPRPPRLFGGEVPAPADADREMALRFCGRPLDPADPEPPPPDVPRAFPARGNCRDNTSSYLGSAALRGIEGRHVVGVAFDGAAFVWHEWAELRMGGRWVAVDPSFRQVPALGPRFAVARFADADAAARAEAGRRVLACWGRSRVEPALAER